MMEKASIQADAFMEALVRTTQEKLRAFLSKGERERRGFEILSSYAFAAFDDNKRRAREIEGKMTTKEEEDVLNSLSSPLYSEIGMGERERRDSYQPGSLALRLHFLPVPAIGISDVFPL